MKLNEESVKAVKKKEKKKEYQAIKDAFDAYKVVMTWVLIILPHIYQ